MNKHPISADVSDSFGNGMKNPYLKAHAPEIRKKKVGNAQPIGCLFFDNMGGEAGREPTEDKYAKGHIGELITGPLRFIFSYDALSCKIQTLPPPLSRYRDSKQYDTIYCPEYYLGVQYQVELSGVVGNYEACAM